MSENDFDITLQDLKEKSVDRLLMPDLFDASAFDEIKDYLWQKAVGLRNEHVISKQILLSLRSASSSIRSRAEYLPDVRTQLHRANEFDLMLDLLIAGETRSDRKPGIPRII